MHCTLYLMAVKLLRSMPRRVHSHPHLHQMFCSVPRLKKPAMYIVLVMPAQDNLIVYQLAEKQGRQADMPLNIKLFGMRTLIPAPLLWQSLVGPYMHASGFLHCIGKEAHSNRLSMVVGMLDDGKHRWIYHALRLHAHSHC